MEEHRIDLDRFRILVAKLEKVQQMLESMKLVESGPGEGWLDNEEASKILKVSRRQLQNYRDQGILPFSQVGNKIYYRAEDLEQHLMNHYKGGF